MPLNLYLIVFGQLIIFLGVYWHYGDKEDSLFKIISFSALFGLVFGISFDVIFGMLGSFTYIPHTLNASSAPWGLTPLQLAVNGIFSYGLLTATAYFFVSKNSPREKHLNKKILIILSLCKVFVAGLIVWLVPPGFLALFASGSSSLP